MGLEVFEVNSQVGFSKDYVYMAILKDFLVLFPIYYYYLLPVPETKPNQLRTTGEIPLYFFIKQHTDSRQKLFTYLRRAVWVQQHD